MDFHNKTLSQDLVAVIDELAQHTQLPAIRELILPGRQFAGDSKYAKFGLLLLEDNSSGFFYRLADLDDNTNQHLLTSLHQEATQLPGMDVAEVAQRLLHSDDINIGIGMAAINAISQHVLAKIGFEPVNAAQSGNYIDRAKRSKHVGMVGYFAPVVKQLGALEIPVTVVELDQNLYQTQKLLTVTGDVTRLEETDYIMCTGSTLLNHSLDTLLTDYAAGRFFELIGPTCGCLANPLFSRGVNQIGGSRVADITAARSRIELGQPWGTSVSKFVIKPEGYPTLPEILNKLKRTESTARRKT